MQQGTKFSYFTILLPLAFQLSFATEFTFDLEDSSEECFHEILEKDVLCELDFQVVSGGQLDVDVYIEGPDENLIYKELRKEFDTFKFNTTTAGEYSICFSNQFSTFTEKSIFLSFVAGKTNAIFNGKHHDPSEDTYLESMTDNIHDNLDNVINGQMHYRMQESYGRRFAKSLNSKVQWWSIIHTFSVIGMGVLQVIVLRNFFSEKQPEKRTYIVDNQPKYFG